MSFYAFVWRNGVIDFGRAVPSGAIAVDYGLAADVRRRVDAESRHAYDGRTLLLPGIPEADTDDEAEVALVAFRQRLEAARRRDRSKRRAAEGRADG